MGSDEQRTDLRCSGGHEMALVGDLLVALVSLVGVGLVLWVIVFG